MNKTKIIAAARSNEELIVAASSNVEIIFMLAPNIADLKKQTELVHKAGKKLFIHLDLAMGIGKDEYGIQFVKSQGVDGIISTRTNIIKLANTELNELGTAYYSDSDALELLKNTRNFIVSGKNPECNMDADGNGKVNIFDLMLLKKLFS